MKNYVFTCGDVNGVGPEIVIKAINRIYNPSLYKLSVICPGNVFEENAAQISPFFPYEFNREGKSGNKYGEKVEVILLPDTEIELGKPTKASGEAAFKAVEKSFQMVGSKEADAVITAPISKYALSLAGIDFPGHTEMYAKWCGSDDYVMMFLSDKMNCALLTIHEPLANVAGMVKKEKIKKTLGIVINTMRQDFRITSPSVAVLGLNPHAGENGMIGREEEDVIIPVLKSSAFRDFAKGPFVPDAFFANKVYREFDVTLGMYHDQVLIPFKLMNFSSGVNFTAGLPIIRTSPDHGTAYDIAGKYIADESSIVEAFNIARKIAENRSDAE